MFSGIFFEKAEHSTSFGVNETASEFHAILFQLNTLRQTKKSVAGFKWTSVQRWVHVLEKICVSKHFDFEITIKIPHSNIFI